MCQYCMTQKVRCMCKCEDKDLVSAGMYYKAKAGTTPNSHTVEQHPQFKCKICGHTIKGY